MTVRLAIDKVISMQADNLPSSGMRRLLLLALLLAGILEATRLKFRHRVSPDAF